MRLSIELHYDKDEYHALTRTLDTILAIANQTPGVEVIAPSDLEVRTTTQGHTGVLLSGDANAVRYVFDYLYRDPDAVKEAAQWIEGREHREYVSGLADEIRERIESTDGDRLEDENDVHEAINEHTITYTHRALEYLRHSKNDTAYWEEYGGDEPNWEEIATAALQADLRDELDNADALIRDRNEREEEEGDENDEMDVNA